MNNDVRFDQGQPACLLEASARPALLGCPIRDLFLTHLSPPHCLFLFLFLFLFLTNCNSRLFLFSPSFFLYHKEKKKENLHLN